LIVHSERDPLVPPGTIDEALREPGARVTVRRLDSGGHVGFPRSVDLGVDEARKPGLGLEAQVIAWLAAR
jgi:predicted alpha/beta-fold hydrolase